MIVDITNRQSFISKKIIDALTKQREKTLLQQKKEHENLIHSIFPPMVAKDLIRRQSSKSLSKVNSEIGSESFGHKNLGHISIGRSVAQMHQEVTILFTDIVGFTAMSQTVAPQQVMEFLHELFVLFTPGWQTCTTATRTPLDTRTSNRSLSLDEEGGVSSTLFLFL